MTHKILIPEISILIYLSIYKSIINLELRSLISQENVSGTFITHAYSNPAYFIRTFLFIRHKMKNDAQVKGYKSISVLFTTRFL